MKEVGFGLDIESAAQLKNVGVSILDVAGRGGTRFDDIEIAMNQTTVNQISNNEIFQNWGYSTIESL